MAADLWVEATEQEWEVVSPYHTPVPRGEARWIRNVYVYRWQNGRRYTSSDGEQTRHHDSWLDLFAFLCVYGSDDEPQSQKRGD